MNEIPIPDMLRDDPTATRIWHETLNMMPAGHFHPMDAPALTGYCCCVSLAGQLWESIRAEGMVIKGKPHPLMKAFNRNNKLTRKLAKALMLPTGAGAAA